MAKKMTQIRQKHASDSDQVIGAEVGRALLSATMGRDAHIHASLSNFSKPISIANAKNILSTERTQLQTQILAELDTFLTLADLSLLRLKLHQQQEQNQKLLQRNNRIAKRTTDRLIRAAHSGDSSILLQQLSSDELESIKIASMTLSGCESGGGSGCESGGGGGGAGAGHASDSGTVCKGSGHGTATPHTAKSSEKNTPTAMHSKRRHKNPNRRTKDKAKASNRRRKSSKRGGSKKDGKGNSIQSKETSRDAVRGRDLLRGQSHKKNIVPVSRSHSL